MAKRVTGRVKARRKSNVSWKHPSVWGILLVALIGGGVLAYFIANGKGDEQKVSSVEKMPTIQLPPTPEQKWAYREELEKREIKNGVLNQQTISRVPEPVIEPQKPKQDNLQQFIEQKVHSVSSPARSQTHSATAGQFGLQCGAFSKQSGAERQKAMLAMLGVVTHINQSGRYYRVQTDALGSKAQAYQQLDALKGKVKCQVRAM